MARLWSRRGPRAPGVYGCNGPGTGCWLRWPARRQRPETWPTGASPRWLHGAGPATLSWQTSCTLRNAPHLHLHLRPLAVDLDELAASRVGDSAEGGGRIDLATGDVWPQLALDYAQERIELGETPFDTV